MFINVRAKQQRLLHERSRALAQRFQPSPRFAVPLRSTSSVCAAADEQPVIPDASAVSQGHAVCASPSFTGSLQWRRAGFHGFLFNWAMPWKTLRPQLSVRAGGIGGTWHDKEFWIPNFLVSLRTNILKYAALLAETGEKIHSYGKLAQKYFK